MNESCRIDAGHTMGVVKYGRGGHNSKEREE